MPNLVEIGPMVLEIFKRCIMFFGIYTLGKGHGRSIAETRSSFTQKAVCQVWMKSVKWLRRKRFKTFCRCFLAMMLLSLLAKGHVVLEKEI